MRKLTVLAVAVMCDGRLYPEDTPIDEIPPGNRESVRLRFSKEIWKDDGEEAPVRPNRAPTNKPKPGADPKVDPPAPPPPPPATQTQQAEGSAPAPSAGGSAAADADTAPPTATPLPPMGEELIALLKAGGIETVEAAQEYFTRNKSFRPLKGVGDSKDLEIRKALGL